MAVNLLFWSSFAVSLLVVMADWRDKEVSLLLLLAFFTFSCLYFWVNFSLIILIYIGIIVIGLIGAEKMNLIGMADCLLIPSCLLWLTPEKTPLFFFCCGFFGVLIALYWKRTRGEITYPFTPSILLSWFLTC